MTMTLTLDHLVGIQQQSSTEEAEEPQREPQERTITVRYLTVGAGLTEVRRCSRTLIQTSSKQQLEEKLWGCVLIRRFLKRKSGLCLSRLQCLIYSSHLQALVYLHLCCLDIQDDHMTGLQFMGKCLLLKLRPLACHFTFSTFFNEYEYVSFLDQNTLSGTIPHLTLCLQGQSPLTPPASEPTTM